VNLADHNQAAFHDRYLLLYRHEGPPVLYLLSNGLNRVAGKWPFCMSRLADDVLPEIQAYIEGLKRGEDVTAAPRRKSPIPGPLASSRQPAFTTPGVPEALRWLLNPKAQTSLPIVRRRAAMNGLLHNRSNIHWSVDGPSIRRLTQRAISRIPSDPEELAIILHGLGECAARCHADLLGAFLTKLNRRDRQLPIATLQNAFRISKFFPHRIELGNHAAAQVLL